MVKIEVLCRRCGRKAPADEFKIDHVYKLAVCRVCYTEREKNLPKKSVVVNSSTMNVPDMPKIEKSDDSSPYEIRKSKIFDEDDVYLEKAVERKKAHIEERRANSVRVKRVSDSKVLYPCVKCNYKFKYNVETKKPIDCPYCGAKVNHDIVF
ncbi:MAG: hypothetical protein ACLFN8_03555 [Candidatus Woesearchaeota archaeon]